jgi:hypothetical protein
MERSSNSLKCPRVRNRHLGDLALLGLAFALLLLLTDHARGAERVKRVLADGWHISQLESSNPDIAELTQEATRPGQAWLPAKIPVP